jgi:signal transduction histidine kinase
VSAEGEPREKRDRKTAPPPTATTTLEPLADWILESMDSGALALDLRKKVVFANRKALHMLGLPLEAVIGKDAHQVLNSEDRRWASVDPADHPGSRGPSRKILATVNGVKTLLETTAFPLKDGREEETGVAVLLREAYLEGEDLEDQTDRLISLGELSASVAHEIRNPLTGIRTTVQFVLSKLPAADPKREDLSEVIQELDRIEQIIEDLLLFSKPKGGNKVPTDLNALLEKILDGMEGQFQSNEIKVERSLSPKLLPILLDPDLIQQVFLNLLINAVEAMPGGGELKITSTLRRYRSDLYYAEVFISDSGMGIDPENIEKIFIPFFTTRSMGTGLGLPISLQIVREHGGKITVRNRTTGGATFRVSLPAGEGEPDED